MTAKKFYTDRRPICVAFNSANQSIPNSAGTNLTFNTDIFDPEDMHSVASNTDRLVITRPGLYVAICGIFMEGGAAGFSQLSVGYNDGSDHVVAFNRANNNSNGVAFAAITPPLNLVAGNYVYASVTQNSGGALNSLSSGTSVHPYAPIFAVWRVGP